MNAHNVSLINALTLIGCSAWAYLGSDTPSVTALIPAGIGVILLALYNGVRKEKKIQSHVAVVFTVLAIIGMVPIFKSMLDRGYTNGIIRAAAMLFTSLLALVLFVKSFIDARKRKTRETKE